MAVVINKTVLAQELKSFNLSILEDEALKEAKKEINRIKQETNKSSISRL